MKSKTLVILFIIACISFLFGITGTIELSIMVRKLVMLVFYLSALCLLYSLFKNVPAKQCDIVMHQGACKDSTTMENE